MIRWRRTELAPFRPRTTDTQCSLFSTASQTFGPIGQIGRLNFGVFGVFFRQNISPHFGTESLVRDFHHSAVFSTKKTVLFRPNPNMILSEKNLRNGHHASVVSGSGHILACWKMINGAILRENWTLCSIHYASLAWPKSRINLVRFFSSSAVQQPEQDQSQHTF